MKNTWIQALTSIDAMISPVVIIVQNCCPSARQWLRRLHTIGSTLLSIKSSRLCPSERWNVWPPGQKSSFDQPWSIVPRMVHGWFNDDPSLDHVGSIHGNATWKNRGQRFLIALIDWLYLHLLPGRTMVLPRFISLDGSVMIQPCSMVEPLMPFWPGLLLLWMEKTN